MEFTPKREFWPKFITFQVTVRFANGKSMTRNIRNESDQSTYDRVVTLLRRVLTVGRIKLFVWNHKKEMDLPTQIEEAIRKSAPFHIEQFWSNAYDQRMPVFFLENCVQKECLQKVCLQGLSATEDPFLQMVKIPKLASAQFIQADMWLIGELDNADFELAKMLIENDAKVGTRFITKCNAEFARIEFGDRIVSKSAKETRIRMDNPKKLILLRSAAKLTFFDVIDAENPEINGDLSHWELDEKAERPFLPEENNSRRR